jgi:hypothetical protein
MALGCVVRERYFPEVLDHVWDRLFDVDLIHKPIHLVHPNNVLLEIKSVGQLAGD